MNNPSVITIYHNPRCRKSRAGLARLQSKGEPYQIKEYMKTGIPVEELRDVLMKLNLRPKEIIRTHEADYKTRFRGKDFTDDEWIQILSENPKLIKRPLVIKKYKAVWADPPEMMDLMF
ncbi:MAG TPA: arsenate reductase family protein [Bacteroidales bacterium]|nr:arsenate reductase family protein [Bacteroidales bacterium]